jgi:hypothetical protein
MLIYCHRIQYLPTYLPIYHSVLQPSVSLGLLYSQSPQPMPAAVGMDPRMIAVHNFPLSTASRRSRPTLEPPQPLIQWEPGIKRQGREAGHSPPTSAEVKEGGAIPPLHYMS